MKSSNKEGKNFFVVGKNTASEEALYVLNVDATELCVSYAVILILIEF